MKRQRFRLASVLRYYELRKERAEYEMQLASRVLQDIDAEIARLDAEVVETATLLERHADVLTTAGLLACYRKAEYLSNRLTLGRNRRTEQANVVNRLAQERKRWAIAVETLTALRANVAQFNRLEAARVQQLQLDESVLRKSQAVEGAETEIEGGS
jgi:hypothetical protein